MVSDLPVPHTDQIIPRVSKATFSKHIDRLLQQFKPLDFSIVLMGQQANVPSIILTFDDGYREMYDIVAPILLEKGVQGIFFVNKDLVGNTKLLQRHKASIIITELTGTTLSKKEKLLNEYNTRRKLKKKVLNGSMNSIPTCPDPSLEIEIWTELLGIDYHDYLVRNRPFMDINELRMLTEKGFWIGGHSVTHTDYGSLSMDKQIEETCESIDYLIESIKIPYRLFAFPYSDKPANKDFFEKIFDLPLGRRPDFIFGNSGIKRDIRKEIIQRISLEKPEFDPIKLINAELLHGLFLGIQIRRK